MHSQSVTHLASGCIHRELSFLTYNTRLSSAFAVLKGLPGCLSAALRFPPCYISSQNRTSLAKFLSSPSSSYHHKLESILWSDQCTGSVSVHRLLQTVAAKSVVTTFGRNANADGCRNNCKCSRSSSHARGLRVRALHSQKEMADDASVDGSAENGADGAVRSRGGQLDRSRVIDFLMLVENLKKMKRTGWVRSGVEGAESIADHMYRMSVMSLLLGNRAGLDRDRCIKLAIVHDIAEAIVGDITPSCGISKEEKSKMEKAAMDKMCGILGGGPVAEEFLELWLEYEHMKTDEAKLIKDFDKLEMILQALEYEKTQDILLEEFFASTTGKFQTDVGKELALEILERRAKRQSERVAKSGSRSNKDVSPS